MSSVEMTLTRALLLVFLRCLLQPTQKATPNMTIIANVTSSKIASLLEDKVLRAYFESTLVYKLRVSERTFDALQPQSFVKNRLYGCVSEVVKEQSRQSCGLAYGYFGLRRSDNTITILGVLKGGAKLFQDLKAPCLFVDSHTKVRTSFQSALGATVPMLSPTRICCLFWMDGLVTLAVPHLGDCARLHMKTAFR